MAVPKNLSPFAQETVYDLYGLSPFASLREIDEQVQKVSAQYETLPPEEKANKTADLQQALNRLKNPRLRVLMNAHLLDPLDPRKAIEVLRNLPGPKAEEITLPALGLSQILIEGECPEYAKDDFQEVTPEPKLALPAEEVNRAIAAQPLERFVQFDS